MSEPLDVQLQLTASGKASSLIINGWDLSDHVRVVSVRGAVEDATELMVTFVNLTINGRQAKPLRHGPDPRRIAP